MSSHLNAIHFKPEFQPSFKRDSLPQILGPRDQRDWILSSLDLREGCHVREVLETLPAELLDLM
ncbi:MAG TPA: hypothetical protein VFY73_19360 [Ideonella sp.]|jgi:hypothetical protein|uniref:hypothetical protein n=1 Tax=Ideonella sp. TaxID=1929293 RepID=UPI002E32A1D6|nr:hypothetical protein [Ideonella sp.]HEX5686192.1 hypothetical protein [Ideonella sp.]